MNIFQLVEFNVFILLSLTILLVHCSPTDGVYKIGVGRADITCPIVGSTLTGFVELFDTSVGCYSKQYCRAFIVGDGASRVVFVSFEAWGTSIILKRCVLKSLKRRYGNLYTNDNVMLSATHTHSCPGGYNGFLMYDLDNKGFNDENYKIVCAGIVKSIQIAHDNLQDGYICVDQTEIVNVTVNRSPTSYLENPEEERAQYKHDTDKTLTQLKFYGNKNGLIGAFNWYAIHPTSLNSTNNLVSSDNVGYATILLEKAMNPDALPGEGPIVIAFASANLGDVSPNIMGPKCERTGEPCNANSKCPDSSQSCYAQGPGKTGYESVKILGQRLYEPTLELLLKKDCRKVKGEIRFIHQFIDMPSYIKKYTDEKTNRTEKIDGCLPCFGISFGAGTTDGPGQVIFSQGTATPNPLRRIILAMNILPSILDINCQDPKPIMLNGGLITFPIPWLPKQLICQLLVIGNIIIVGMPGEFTTMSGRRLREAVKKAVVDKLGTDVVVIVAGHANMYNSYIATYEEYQAQRYEAASTLFGPYTLTIIIDTYLALTEAVLNDQTVLPGKDLPTFDFKIYTLSVPEYDTLPVNKNFGDVMKQPNHEYVAGSDVIVTFISTDPKHLQNSKYIMTVERETENKGWNVVTHEGGWEMKLEWSKKFLFLALSKIVEVTWMMPPNTIPGIYRICHYGKANMYLKGLVPYDGITNTFAVKSPK